METKWRQDAKKSPSRQGQRDLLTIEFGWFFIGRSGGI